ncbi:hypothetical protein GBK02_15945 [Dechloromonas sp. TW-R-39-2]|uniref:hypothetical protein n=1 Tax=Dechloromonas sp. TW-R-39-2 TaxID=2654218 RepID=UPI00193D9121|nr:hypothetical protein [Dechloromonas sp. TW-R-39-2]QRM20759.1 hypothetical protein GBK02_15945 [Dechloromonas sp. TW-R-39-2]
MNLEQIEKKLLARLERIGEHVLNFAVSADLNRTGEKEWMHLEGLVSSLWQSWGHFCRDVVMFSATGCTTASGNVLAPSVAPARWERVSYIAKQTRGSGSPILAGRTNSTLRLEPTWGDVGVLATVIPAANPVNRSQLLSAFGLGVQVSHLQTVRNAAAHRNGETMRNVLAIAHLYNLPRPPRHPIEALYWVDVASGDYAIEAWADEMRKIASVAVQ